MITKDNFHIASIGVFFKANEPSDAPNYISKNAEGVPHSWYWFGKDENGEYVIRKSSHWGIVRNCNWHLEHEDFILISNQKNKYNCKDSLNIKTMEISFATGKCYFEEMDWISY